MSDSKSHMHIAKRHATEVVENIKSDVAIESHAYGWLFFLSLLLLLPVVTTSKKVVDAFKCVDRRIPGTHILRVIKYSIISKALKEYTMGNP